MLAPLTLVDMLKFLRGRGKSVLSFRVVGMSFGVAASFGNGGDGSGVFLGCFDGADVSDRRAGGGNLV